MFLEGMVCGLFRFDCRGFCCSQFSHRVTQLLSNIRRRKKMKIKWKREVEKVESFRAAFVGEGVIFFEVIHLAPGSHARVLGGFGFSAMTFLT